MLKDLAWAVRSHRATLRASLLATLMLATGIGASLAVFATFDRVLFRPLPYAAPERLAHLHVTILPVRGSPAAYLPYEVALELMNRTDLFEGLAWADGVLWDVRPAPGEDPLRLTAVTPNTLDVLGVRPVIGRGFVAGDVSITERAVILSYQAWASRFTRRADLSNAVWKLGDLTYRVVGVLPKDFLLPSSRLIDSFDGLFADIDERLSQNQNRGYVVAPFVRLRTGVSIPAAQAAIDAVVTGRDWASPTLRGDFASGRRRVTVQHLHSGMSLFLQPYPWLVVCSIWVVLGLTTANLSLLLLARNQSRLQDRAVRLALGASSLRLARLTLLEAGVLCFASAILAWSAYTLTYSSLLSIIPAPFRTFAIKNPDGRLIAVATFVPLLCAVAASAVPLWHGRRTDLIRLLRLSGETYSQRLGYAGAYLVVETAASAVALVLAFATVPQFLSLVVQRPGFAPDDLFVVTVNHGAGADYGEQQRSRRVRAITEALNGQPGVVSSAAVFWVPFYNSGSDNTFWEQHGIQGSIWAVDAGVFKTLGTTIIAGREFSEREVAGRAPVAVLNASAARALWPQGTPSEVLGLTVRTRDGIRTIIGIAADVRRDGFTAAQPGLFLPISAQEVSPTQTGLPIMVRMQPGNRPDRRLITRRLNEQFGLDSIGIESVSDRLAERLQRPRFLVTLFGTMAFVALLLSAVGHYAVAALWTERVRREVAIRQALGASPVPLRNWLVSRLALPTVSGLAIGLLAGWFVYHLARSQVAHIGTPSLPAYLAATLMIVIAAGPIIWSASGSAIRESSMDMLRQ